MQVTNPPKSKIFVRYNKANPSEEELRAIFIKHGTIAELNRYAKFCFIEYNLVSSAMAAVLAENGTKFKDVTLEVEMVVRNISKKRSAEAEANKSNTTEEVESKPPETKKSKQDEERSNEQLENGIEPRRIQQLPVSVECPAEENSSSEIPVRLTVPMNTILPKKTVNVTKQTPHYLANHGLKSETVKNQNILTEEHVLLSKGKDVVQSKEVGHFPQNSSAHLINSEDGNNYLSSAGSSLGASAYLSSSAQKDYQLNSTGPYYSYQQQFEKHVPDNLPLVNSKSDAAAQLWPGYWPAEQGSVMEYSQGCSYPSSAIYAQNYHLGYLQKNFDGTGNLYAGISETKDFPSNIPPDRHDHVQNHLQQNDSWSHQNDRLKSHLKSSDRTDSEDCSRHPDLVNYASVHSVTKPNQTPVSQPQPVKMREPKVAAVRADENSITGKTQKESFSGSTSLSVSHECSESGSHFVANLNGERSASLSDSAGICEIIITEPQLRQYALKVASRIHSTGLKIEICDLPPGMTTLEEVEDAMVRNCLFVVVITKLHVERNSVTVDILHGIPEEHRNMIVDDAVPLITASYRKYVALKQEPNVELCASSNLVTEALVEKVLPPNERIKTLIECLTRNVHLSHEELEELIMYLRQCQKDLKKQSTVSSVQPGKTTICSRNRTPEDSVKTQKESEATIFSRPATQKQDLPGTCSASRSAYQNLKSPGHCIKSDELYRNSSDFRHY